MKELIDLHVVLATPADFDQWEEEAEEAADKFNIIIYALFDAVEDDIKPEVFEAMLQHVWEVWSVDQQILQIDDADFVVWVNEMLNGWDYQSSQRDSGY